MASSPASTWILGLALSLACLPGCKKKAPAADDTAAAGPSPLRPLIAETLGASSFAVVGDVARGERRAIVVWPGLVEGEPSPLVAFVFAREGAAWKPMGERIELPRREGDRVLFEALGGEDDVRILRNCGLPQDELAAHLKAHGATLAAAMASGDAEAASTAYEQLARAFDWQHVATSTMLLDLMGTKAPKTWYCGPKGCTVESDWEGRRRMQTFANADCGEGKVVGRALAAEP